MIFAGYDIRGECKKSAMVGSDLPLKWLFSAKKARWLGQIQPNDREFLAFVKKNHS